MLKNLPIGVFDSGIGGLTVLKALRQCLPNEDLLYLGDTARLPYGTKSPQTVCLYAKAASQVLLDRGIKLLVVACNTASAVALGSLEDLFYPIPVIGVIDAAAQKAASESSSGRIAVIATESTVESGAYRKAIQSIAPSFMVREQACSFFVALAEEGWTTGLLVEAILRAQLAPLWEDQSLVPDSLILGCTHFPVLRASIEASLSNETRLIHKLKIVDPALETAKLVAKSLLASNTAQVASHKGKSHFMVTDGLGRFARVASTFLDYSLEHKDLELVDL
jgi:glutamate racemase